MAENGNMMLQPRSGNGADFTDPAIVAARESARARIESAYLVANHKKRDYDDSRQRILKACERTEFAEKVEFSKPVGNTKVNGPSARFAEHALREWGNILSESQIIYEDDMTRRVKVFLTDLETNTTFSKEIAVRKTVERKKAGEDRIVLGERKNTWGDTVYIVVATEDEIENKINAQLSKAVRNEGLRLIPTDIVDEAIAKARETLRKRGRQDPEGEKKKLFDGFSKLGIPPAEIKKYLGHDCQVVTPKELDDLRTIYVAIKDGEATWHQYVETAEKEGNEGDQGEGSGKKEGEAQDPFEVQIGDRLRPKYPDVELERVLVNMSKTYNMTIEQIKASALKKPEAFEGAVAKIAAEIKKDQEQKGEGKEEGEPPIKDDALRLKEFIHKRKTGFKPWVINNMHRILVKEKWSKTLVHEIRKKFLDFYPGEPFPLDKPEAGEQGRSEGLESTNGENEPSGSDQGQSAENGSTNGAQNGDITPFKEGMEQERLRLGNEVFMRELGNLGYTSISEVPETERMKVWNAIEKVPKPQPKETTGANDPPPFANPNQPGQATTSVDSMRGALTEIEQKADSFDNAIMIRLGEMKDSVETDIDIELAYERWLGSRISQSDFASEDKFKANVIDGGEKAINAFWFSFYEDFFKKDA